MSTATLIADTLDGWAPVTRLYALSDGQFIAVTADLADYPDPDDPLETTILRTPTTILFCNETGVAVDLVADWIFDPGTAHDDAVELAGYNLITTPEETP